MLLLPLSISATFEEGLMAQETGPVIRTISYSCCLLPEVGDLDLSGSVDITDIAVLIDSRFLTLPPCP